VAPNTRIGVGGRHHQDGDITPSAACQDGMAAALVLQVHDELPFEVRTTNRSV
jgi:hypothetical protein